MNALHTLDMGKPVLIVELAHTLIKLSGIPEKEVEVAFTGLRPGEKLYEELFYDHEQQGATRVSGIMQAKNRRFLGTR